MIQGVLFIGSFFFVFALFSHKCDDKPLMHLPHPHQGSTEMFPPPFSLAHIMLQPVLESQLVNKINTYHVTVVIINHVETQIIHSNKGLPSLIQYFPCFPPILSHHLNG